jgi:hypothetical protein
MTFWQKVLCFIGDHDQEVIASVRCRMWRSVFDITVDRNIFGVAKVLKCKSCGDISAWLSDGATSQKIDLDDAFTMIPTLKTAYEQEVCNA